MRPPMVHSAPSNPVVRVHEREEIGMSVEDVMVYAIILILLSPVFIILNNVLLKNAVSVELGIHPCVYFLLQFRIKLYRTRTI